MTRDQTSIAASTSRGSAFAGVASETPMKTTIDAISENAPTAKPLGSS